LIFSALPAIHLSNVIQPAHSRSCQLRVHWGSCK